MRNRKDIQSTETLSRALKARGINFSGVSCEFRDHQRNIAVRVIGASVPDFEYVFILRCAGEFCAEEAGEIADQVRNDRVLVAIGRRMVARFDQRHENTPKA